MAVNTTTVQKRVTAILNAAQRDAFGFPLYATSIEDARRNVSSIIDAVYEAVQMVAEARCSSDANPGRIGFISLVSVTHGATLPAHYGPPGRPQIQLYSGGPWVEGTNRPAAEIESYRINPDEIYDDIAHDAEGSTLSAFYDFVGDAIVFTGFACRVPLANFTTPEDAATKLPASDEGVCVCLAVGLSKTEGDSGVLDGYFQQGYAALQQIRAGAETVKPVEMAERAA